MKVIEIIETVSSIKDENTIRISVTFKDENGIKQRHDLHIDINK